MFNKTAGRAENRSTLETHRGSYFLDFNVIVAFSPVYRDLTLLRTCMCEVIVVQLHFPLSLNKEVSQDDTMNGFEW